MLKTIFLSTTALLAATPALAEPSPDATTLPGDAIVVTATRTPTETDRIASSITVLTKEAIDQSQDIGVTELLARTPGISITRNGGYGTSTSVRIRGAETDHTVVVIDGVKLNDPSSTGGGYNFANLLVGDIDRIEILRGPQSILWGSQAIGGVVNIVTATPDAPLEASADIEAGSRETVNARGGIGGKTGPVAWRVGGHTFTTDGISAYAPGTEADGYRNVGLNGRATVTLTDNVSLDLRGYWTRGRNEFDGFNTDSPEYGITEEFVGYAGLNVALFDGRFRNRFAYGYTDTRRDNFNPGGNPDHTFDAKGRNERIEYQGTFDIAQGWTAIVGAENERSRFFSASPPFSEAEGKAEITSFYGQLSAEPLSGLTLTGGVRHDDHKTYGGQTLFQAGAVWALETGTILRANYGEAFKAPSLYQLFSEYGNTTLRPEEAEGWEAGIEQHLFDDALTLGATWFDRDTTNQIDFFSCFGTTGDPLCVNPDTGLSRFGYYANTARTHAQGIELGAAARIGTRFTLSGNYSWIEAENRVAGANFGNWLPRRPRETANLSADYDWAFGLSTGFAVRWSGKSYDNASNTTVLDAYTLVDLRAEYALSDNVRLFGRVENLFDEEYETVRNYGTLGRSVYAGIRTRF